MGIINNLESRASAGTIGPPRDPVVAEWFGAGSRTSSGVSVNGETAMRVTTVFACVSLRARTMASLPLSVEKYIDGGHETDQRHPLHNLLAWRPNKWQTSFEWREMMEAHFALRGKCYSEILSTGGRGISQLIPLHPDRVRPFWVEELGELAFEYSPLNGPTRIIMQGEMFFMHLMSGDGVTPVSPIQLHREAIGLAMATEEHGARLFGNGARPSGILKTSGRFKDDIARENLRKSWQAIHGGVDNSNRVAVLEDGLEWQQVGMTSEDAQFLETRNFQIPEICRIFCVPPHKIGDLTRSTNNNIEHQGIEWVTDFVRPQAIRWEQAMQRDLLDWTTTHTFMFDLEDLMRGDAAARAKYNASALQNGWMNRNEARVSDGRNRSDAPGMDDFTVQSNLIPIGKLGTLGAPAKNPIADDEET